jgi:hypothetical protein
MNAPIASRQTISVNFKVILIEFLLLGIGM